MSDAVYELALTATLDLEGGFTVDNGGPTMCGVTQRAYDSYRRRHRLPLQSVRLITLKEVRELYREDYFDAARCTQLPARMAILHFDWAVNHGPAGAIRTLQAAARATPDGVWGPKTEAAVKAASQDEPEFMAAYMAARDRWYDENHARVAPEAYNGWRNRVHRLWAKIVRLQDQRLV